MMQSLLLLANCDLGSLITSTIAGTQTINWLSINMLVVLLSITVAAFIYALSNFLPREREQRLKTLMRYEMFESMLSIVIIIGLIGFSAFTCSSGALLVGQSQGYTGVYNFDSNYINGMIRTTGFSIVSHFYATSMSLTIASNIYSYISSFSTSVTSKLSQLALTALFNVPEGLISFHPSPNPDSFLKAYSSIITAWYGGLMLASFGPLFILLLLLPIIEAGSLTVVVPVALIMRSLSFGGSKIREVSNLFLAMGIGFYFVLPLTIVFNVYVASCVGVNVPIAQGVCPTGGPGAYPLAGFLNDYNFPTTSSSIFSGQGQTPICVDSAFTNLLGGIFSSVFKAGNCNLDLLSGFYGSLSTIAPIQSLSQAFSDLVHAPEVAAQNGQEVSGYFFLGVLMFALDMAITAGFINGFGKSMNTVANLFGVESFWRD